MTTNFTFNTRVLVLDPSRMGYETCRYWRDGLISEQTEHEGIVGVYVYLWRPQPLLIFAPMDAIDDVLTEMDAAGVDPVNA